MNLRTKLHHLATVLVGASFFLPWFTYERVSGGVTRETWGLLYDRRCSNFAREAVECRTELIFERLGHSWDLVPLWTIARVHAVVLALLLIAMLLFNGRQGEHDAKLPFWGKWALRAFAILVAALPGDMRFRAFEPSWGVGVALVGALIVYVKPLPWERWTLDERRRRIRCIAGALCILSSACWFQWIYQLEAITPIDPDEQSAYSYGTFVERHHWHEIRAEREHYWGDDIRSLEPRRLKHDLDKVTAIAAGVAGIVLATLLLSGPYEVRRRPTIVALVAFALLGATFPFLVGGSIPGPGAILAIVGIALTSWVLRQRDGPRAF